MSLNTGKSENAKLLDIGNNTEELIILDLLTKEDIANGSKNVDVFVLNILAFHIEESALM
jgi:hypothetical protein